MNGRIKYAILLISSFAYLMTGPQLRADDQIHLILNFSCFRIYTNSTKIMLKIDYADTNQVGPRLETQFKRDPSELKIAELRDLCRYKISTKKFVVAESMADSLLKITRTNEVESVKLRWMCAVLRGDYEVAQDWCKKAESLGDKQSGLRGRYLRVLFGKNFEDELPFVKSLALTKFLDEEEWVVAYTFSLRSDKNGEAIYNELKTKIDYAEIEDNQHRIIMVYRLAEQWKDSRTMARIQPLIFDKP